MRTTTLRMFTILVFLTVLVPAVQAVEPSDSAQIIARVDSLRVQFKARQTLALIEEFLPAAQANADSNLLLNLKARKGGVLSAVGHCQEAELVLTEVIAMAETLRDTLNLLESIRWLGVALEGMRRPAEARQHYDRLLAVAEKHGSPQYQGWAQVGLAWQDHCAGHSSESVRRYRQAITHFESGPPAPGLAWTWNGLGTAYSDLGEYSEALDCFGKAADIARTSNNLTVESMALNNRGTLAYSLGDPGEAVGYFIRSAEIQNAMGYFQGAFQPSLNIVLCYIRLGRYDDAEADLLSLQAECQQRNLIGYEGRVLRYQADIEIYRGHSQRAISLFHQALDLGDPVPLKSRIEIRNSLGNYLHFLGRTDEAMEIYREGELEIANRDLFEQALGLKAGLGRALLDQGQHREALTHLLYLNNQAKSRGLNDRRILALVNIAAAYRALDRPDSSLAMLMEAVELWEAEREVPLDPEWREELGQYGRWLYTDLAAQLLEPDPTISERDRIRKAFDQIQIFKARTLLERMLGPGAAASASVGAMKELTLDHLQWDVLQEGELFLDFYLGPNVSFMFAVTRSECRVKTLPTEEELTRKMQYYFRFLASSPRADEAETELEIIRATGSQIRTLLLGGMEDLLTAADLVFWSPDGVLNLLAPAALQPVSEQTIESWARIPSATVLARIRECGGSASINQSSRILALAGTNRSDGIALPGAQREVDMLARQFQDVDLRISESTNTITTEAQPGFEASDLAPYEVLHIAAHASVNNQYPWNSAIHVSDTGNGNHLTAASIATTRLNARLAVLAACESAGGRVLSGEGVLGLTSAFISAGVPAVVATLWPVDDTKTTLFMKHFYAGLADGLDAAMALQAAQTILRKNPVTEHPIFWAGYVLVGDGQIQLSLKKRLPLLRIILMLLAAGMVVLLLYSFRRTR